MYLPVIDELNETILFLLGVYIVGAFASMIRAWLYTLAGQRLVARIRKMVCAERYLVEMYNNLKSLVHVHRRV